MSTTDRSKYLLTPGLKEADVVAYVHKRLQVMSSLKAHRVPLTRSYATEYADSALLPRHPKKADFRTNTGKALVDSKLSDFIASMPKFDFQPLDEDSMGKVPVAKRVWDYWWKIGGTEAQLLEMATEAFIKGSSAAWLYVRNDSREVSFPDGRGGWKTETVEEIQPMVERVSFENFYIDSNRLDRASQCAFVRHWPRAEFLNVRGAMLRKSGIADSDIPEGKRYDWYSNESGNVSYGTKGPDDLLLSWPRNDNRSDYVSEVHFYDKDQDAYVIVANDRHINAVEGRPVSPMPSLHKQLPIAIMTDHYIEDDYCGRGEYDVTAEPRRLKDAAVSLGIDLAKASVGAFFATPEANFDGGMVKFGTDEVNEIGDLEGLKHFTPGVNPQFAQYIEQRADDYIVMASGVDFKSQLMSPSETASKTVAKVETQKRRVNLCQRLNAWNFFARFAKLRMGDILLIHKSGKRTISVEGETVVNGSSVTLNSGYGVFTVKPDDMPEKVNVLPNIESMATDTSQKRQDFLQALQIYGSIAGADGKPLVPPEFWLDSGKPFFPDIDFERAKQKTEVSKSPEQLMQEAGLMGDGAPTPQPGMEGEQPMDPNYVPPAQRSGAKKAVSTPGSAPKVAASL